MKNRINTIKFYENIKRYFLLYKWIFFDTIGRFKFDAILTLASGTLGVFSQVSAIGISIYYMRILENNKSLTILKHEVDVGSSVIILVFFSCGILFSMVISSWLQYYHRQKVFNLRKEYEIFCAKRALKLISKNYFIKVPEIQKLPVEKRLLRVTRGDSSFCGRVFQMLLEGVTPFITFIASVFTLFATKFNLTLLIILFLSLSIRFHFKNNKLGANSSTNIENNIAKATIDFLNLIKVCLNFRNKFNYFEPIIDRHYENGPTKLYWNSLQLRRIITEKSKLINNNLFAFIFFSIIIIFGWDSITGNHGFTKLVVYLVSLRYCLVNFQSIIAKITSINRFYPQFKRYADFINNNQENFRYKNEFLKYEIKIKKNKLVKSLDSYHLKENDNLAILCNNTTNRIVINQIVQAMFWHSDTKYKAVITSYHFINANFERLNASIRELFGFSEDFSNIDLHKAYGNYYLDKTNMDHLLFNIDKVISKDEWYKISNDLKYVISAIYAVHYNYKWVFFDAEKFYKVSPLTRQSIIYNLQRMKKVFIYRKNIDLLLNSSFSILAIADLKEKSLLGIGKSDEWIKSSISYYRNKYLNNSRKEVLVDDGFDFEEEAEIEDL